MLSVGETVLYGSAGACPVKEICTRKFGDAGEKKYYVLTPIHDTRTTLYVPVENQAVQAKIKHLLTAEEIEELILSMPKEDPVWISDEKKRQEEYKAVLRRGDRRELMSMTKALYAHRRSMAAIGRKLHMADEKMFREAEKLLCDEFAVVLDMEPSEVLPFIIQKLEG